jgi:hypothetical protein
MPDFDELLLTDLKDHVFGLGLISLRYNLFETSLRFILSNYVGPPVLDLLFERASNEQRAYAIRSIAQQREPKAVMDHVDHMLAFFSICAENRNVLMHSRQSYNDEMVKEGALTLEKRVKAGGKNIYQLDLPIIRQVARDMVVGISYLMEVDKLMTNKPLGLLSQLTLPQKPRLPEKLNPHQPVVNLQISPSEQA